MTVRLANGLLQVHLSDSGSLLRLEEMLGGADRTIVQDGWAITLGNVTLSDRDATLVASAGTSWSHRFRFALGAHTVELTYDLEPRARYLRRMLRLDPVDGATTLTAVRYGPLTVAASPSKVVPYDTFRDCPTVTFLRWGDGHGWFLGIQNPVFETRADGSPEGFGVTQGYAPGLLLAAGEGHDADSQFIGTVRLTGDRLVAEPPKSRISVGEEWPRGRFRDPIGHVPIDRGEIAAMRACVAEYLAPLPTGFRSILYTYWYPVPQPPLDDAGVARWMQVIDTFADLGGDLLLTTPLARSSLPAASHAGYWDIAPRGSGAEQVMRHARSRDIRVGLYMGVAAGNLEHGNAAALDYPHGAPDAWKKVGEDGTVSGENCMASDAFRDWSVAVQGNTIERFGLAGWSWDPGPGNARFCHATGHGHLPGQGSYRGWRNATEVRRRLKERFPDLFLQAFYGQKEDGPWGLRYFDQHEAYWEQQVEWGASIHPDLKL